MRHLSVLVSLLAIALPLATPGLAGPTPKTQPAATSTSAPRPPAISLGLLTCTQLGHILSALDTARRTKDHQIEMEAEGFLTFLLGYASGHRGDAVITRDVDEQIGNQIQGFCKANPKASFLDAVRALP